MTSILNLAGFNVLRVEEADHDYHVYADSTASVTACAHCQSKLVVGFGRRERLIRDLPAHGKRVGIYVNARRFQCRGCAKTFFERLPHVDPSRDMTTRLVDWIGLQSIKRPFAHIAEETGVVEGTVRAIFGLRIAALEAKHRFETPEVMGIDEIHIIKRPRAVIGNVQSNTILDMLEDRNKKTVATYFYKMPSRQRVRLVAMDMWTPYRDAVKDVLPGARVVVDKFHVVKMANTAVEAVRKAHRASLTPKARRGLMHDRFVLLKRASALSEKDALLLSGWTANFPALRDAYAVKEAFFGFYDSQTKDEAARYYEAWQNSIPETVAWAFKDITTAFGNWQPLILEYFDHRITNAFSESMNNLIRLMNRVGRGYSFEALRAKVLYTDKLHKIQRPKFERRVETYDMEMFQKLPPPMAAAREKNLGVDISTLIGLLEADGF